MSLTLHPPKQVPPFALILRGMSASSVVTTIYSNTVYSDQAWDPDARAKPPKADHLAAALFRDSLERDAPGAWSSDRMRQALHYVGVPHIAIRAVMNFMRSCSYVPMKRKRKNRNRTTFGPNNVVAKASVGQQSQGRDEDYVPFEDEDHPVCRMAKRPNPNESIGLFAAKLTLQNRLTGVGPCWAVPNSQDKPVQLWALRTPFLYPLYQMSANYPHGAWRVNPYRAPGWMGATPMGMGAGGAIIPGEHVARWMEPHPLIDWDGWAPMEAGAVQLDVFDSIEVSMKSAMDNGLGLDAVLIAPGMSTEAATALRANVENRHKGAGNAKKFLVVAPDAAMMGEKFDLKTFSQTVKDMEYSKAREVMVQFILALFQVPPTVAGLSEPGAYAADYAAEQRFHRMQAAFLDSFAEWFTQNFYDPWSSFPDEYLLKATPRPINDHERQADEFERKLKYDLLTYNQALAVIDLPPVPGGDVLRSVYVASQTQAAMPQPQPQPGADTLATADPTQEDGAKPPVPGERKRDHGRFAPAGFVSPPSAPANPAGAGSLPPRPGVGKAMNEAVGSEGGFLVPSTGVNRLKRKRKGLRRVLGRVLKGLSSPEPIMPVVFTPAPTPKPEPLPPPPPVINNYINVPEQPAPVVNAPVTVNVPEQVAPVVNNVVNVPPPPPPVPMKKTSIKVGDRWETVEEVVNG